MSKIKHLAHAVIVPLFGAFSSHLHTYLQSLSSAGLLVILVDNNPQNYDSQDLVSNNINFVFNGNRGGIAGGFNAGVELALSVGSQWITLLDQDSRIDSEHIFVLSQTLSNHFAQKWVVGPSIWDLHRQESHGRYRPSEFGLNQSRMLISSGSTFSADNWPALGGMHEDLFIDFVDHAWCFRAQSRGFCFYQHPNVVLSQCFGEIHPNRFCRMLGMQLYSPERHFYSLRNLRWLCLQSFIPTDIKFKELFKMLFKPFIWLLFEPRRKENLRSILHGLFVSLPGRY